MGRRQAEYYLGFQRLLGEHVEQIVLYIGREPMRLRPLFETPTMRYEFQLLDIREADGESLLASDDWGDNLLALLTQVEQERVLQRVEQQIRKLKGEEQETAARLLVIMLDAVFGALPEWVTDKLGNANEAELIAWGKRVRSAQSLDHIFKD
jgi:hypothetical protein